MKNFKNFFMKHKIKIFLSIAIILAACTITAVSIALWNQGEDEEYVYTPVVNPSEKYLEYYVVVENASSTDGFDYYPVSRVPESLVEKIYGLAVARYDGFMTEVEIPETASVKINGNSVNTYPVTHIIGNYTQLVGNGFNSSITKLVLPKTIKYVESGALANINAADIYVAGTYEYTYENLSVTGNDMVIYNGSDIIDNLIKYDENNYISTSTLKLYNIEANTIDYVSTAETIKIDSADANVVNGSLITLDRIYGLPEGVIYHNDVARKNTMTYSLSSDDLFGITTGIMISDGGNNYHRYIINKTENNTVTINGQTATLANVGRYKVSYNGSSVQIEEITYSGLTLDTLFTDYERYVGDVEATDGQITVDGLTKSDLVSGKTYSVVYTPDTLFTDLSEVTRLSVYESHYIHEITSTVLTDDEVAISTKTTFVLPEVVGRSYFAEINGEIIPLNKMDSGVYSLDVTSKLTGSVVIRGVEDNELVYESHKFDYKNGKEYDLSKTNTSLVTTSKTLESKEYKFEVSLPSNLTGTLYINFKGQLLGQANPLSLTCAKTISNGKILVDASDITDVILKNAGILTNQYIFTKYDITLHTSEDLSSNTIATLYHYENDSTYEDSNDLDFYHKNYVLTYKEVESNTRNYSYTSYEMDRNFANVSELEYYYLLADSTNYVISSNSSISSIGESDLYVSNANYGVALYNKENHTSKLLDLDYVDTYDDELLIDGVGVIHIEETRNKLEPGTYRVTYDGANYTYTKVEGAKRYYISSSENGIYTELELNISNTLYEEYTISNYSSNSDTIYIKDDLDNVYSYKTLTVEGVSTNVISGLYLTITFSLDNLKRTDNNYAVFTSLKGTLSDTQTTLVLVSEGVEVTYYSVDGTTPSYESVFELKEGYEFAEWSLIEGKYHAQFNKFVLVNEGNGYVVSEENDDKKIYVGDTFTVKPAVGYTISSVKVNNIDVLVEDGVYSITDASLAGYPLVIGVTPNQYTITLDGNDTPISYTFGNEHKFDVPTKAGTTFLYYFDKETGIIYTDNQGNLLSPYMVTKDVTLTPVYTDFFYVIINQCDSDGNYVRTKEMLEVKGGLVATYNFPRISGMHYSKINAYSMVNNEQVNIDIDEYEHSFSFVMPKSNVVININYEQNLISYEEDEFTPGESKPFYVLVPSNLGKNVSIYDHGNGVVEMTRLPYEDQIYSGFLAYKLDDYNTGNKYIQVYASGEESYIYTNTNGNNLLIIDNFSLETEVGSFSNWLSIEKTQNVYTIPLENVVDVIAIEGDIDEVDDEVNGVKVITVKKGIITANEAYYERAKFEVVVANDPIKMSFVVTYNAYGTEENPILINYDYDFYTFFNNKVISYLEGLHFKQTGDVIVEDDNGYNIVFNNNNPFNHIYDGCGYTITYNQNEIRDNYSNGLFGYIGQTGVVKNISLNYNLISTNNIGGYKTKYYLGSVASVNQGDIINITTSPQYISANNVRYVGGIVAVNAGDIDGCENNIAFNLNDYGVNYSNIVGGIAGYNIFNITNCENYAKQSIDTETGRHTYSGDIAALDKGNITDCISYSSSMNDMVFTTKKTIYFTANTAWAPQYGESFYAYAYNKASGEYEKAWPGIEMSWVADDGSEKIFKVDLEPTSDAVIFSDGNGDGDRKTNEVNISNAKSHTQFWPNSRTHDTSVGSGHEGAYFGKLYKNTTDYVLTDGTNEYSLYQKAEGDKKQLLAIEIPMTVGQKLYLKDTVNNLKFTGFNIDSVDDAFNYEDGVINCIKSGTYSIYINFNSKTISSNNLKTDLAKKNVEISFVDDWWFVDEIIEYSKSKYYVESVIKIDCKDSKDNVLGSFVYTYEQTHQFNNMNSIDIEVLANTTSIDISRVVAIRNYDNGMDRFYFSYDGNGRFSKINNVEFTSYPDNTYTVNVALNSDVTKENIYVYTVDSELMYATKGPDSNGLDSEGNPIVGPVDFCSAAAITTTRDILSYVDIKGLEEYDSYRVKYYDTQGNLLAIRSYVKGEQVQILAGVHKMDFEVSYEGNGVKIISSQIVSSLEHNTYTFEEIEHATAPGTGTYELLLYNEEGECTVVGLTKDSTKAEHYVKNLYVANDDYYFTVRKVGQQATFGTLTFDSWAQGAKLSTYGNEILFTTATGHFYDIYVKVDNPNIPQIYTSYSQIDTYTMTPSFINNQTDIDYNETELTLEENAPKFNLMDKASYSTQAGIITRVYYLSHAEDSKIVTKGYVELSSTTMDMPYFDDVDFLHIIRYYSDGTNKIIINKVVVNTIYQDKTLVINKPYDGYYDASWVSSVDDRNYIYFEAAQNSKVLLHYTLNDGRVGSIAMKETESLDASLTFYKLQWGSVIGLNPTSISFSVDGIDVCGGNQIKLDEVDILGDNCYFLKDGVLSKKPYSDYNELNIYIDEHCNYWNEYYIQIGSRYYEMEEVSDRHYVAYLPISNGDRYYITSNPKLTDIIRSDELVYSDVNSHLLVCGYNDSQYILESTTNSWTDVTTVRDAISYPYYLVGTLNNFESLNTFGLTSYNLKYYTFLELSEDATFYLVDNAGNKVANTDKTLGSGLHMIVYDGTNLKTYSNYLVYRVDFMYGDALVSEYFTYGEKLTLPVGPSSEATSRYKFSFDAWVYDGRFVVEKLPETLPDGRSEEDYVLVSDLSVRSNMVLYPSYSITPQQYTITFISEHSAETDSVVTETLTVDYGQSISSILMSDAYEGIKANLETPYGKELGHLDGWYLDEKFYLSADDHIVRSDITLNAKWYLAGMYLMGRTEGYLEWSYPRSDYRLKLVDTDGGRKQYEIETVFLQTGDLVKIAHFDGSSPTMEWYPKNNEWKDFAEGKNDADGNFVVPSTGYYDFYLHWEGYYDTYVYVVYHPYLISYDVGEEGQIHQDDLKLADYRFDFGAEQSIEIVDKDETHGNKASSPRVTTTDGKVLFGWFNEQGERITTLTKDMMDSRNNYKLYAQYVTPGYYVNTIDDAHMIQTGSEDAIKLTLTRGQTFRIYHFNGSVRGCNQISYLVGSNTVDMDYVPSNDRLGAYNEVTVNNDGEYWIYLSANGVCVDQYHEVTYIMGSSGSILEHNMEYTTSQLFGSELEVLTHNENVDFLGWMLNPQKEGKYIEMVNDTMTVYAIYRIGETEGSVINHTHKYIRPYMSDSGLYYMCEYCDDKELEHEHAFEYSSDIEVHWKVCSNCGYNTAKTAHSYKKLDYNADYHWYVCECGAADSKTTAHTKSNYEKLDDNYHVPECSCGYMFEAERHTHASYKGYNDGHTSVCVNCKEEYGKVGHVGGNATETSQAICESCSVGYGEILDVTIKIWVNDYSNNWGANIYIYVWKVGGGDQWFQCNLVNDNGDFGDYYEITLSGLKYNEISGFKFTRGTSPTFDKNAGCWSESSEYTYASYSTEMNNNGKVTYYGFPE